MRKLIAAINMTLDGFCDHTAMIADEEIHQHYNELLSNAGTLLYGRITYQLMESHWPSVVNNPTGNKPMDEFAEAFGVNRAFNSKVFLAPPHAVAMEFCSGSGGAGFKSLRRLSFRLAAG